MNALAVFVGGGLGAVVRWLVGRGSMAWFGTTFPWGTLAVNIIGSFLIGLSVGAFSAFQTGYTTRLLLVTGFLGGFTTFSAFSLDALTLWERGQHGVAGAYVVASIFLSLAAVVAGMVVSRLF